MGPIYSKPDWIATNLGNTWQSQGPFKGKKPPFKKGASKSAQDQSRAVCHNCGKPGHYIRDCWSKGGGKEGQGPKRAKATKTNQSQSAYQATKDHESFADDFDIAYTAIHDAMHASIDSYDWIADTGATAHIVPDRSLFHDYTEVTDNSVVHGVGNTAKVVGKKSIKLKFDLGSKKPVVHTLTNVLHILVPPPAYCPSPSSQTLWMAM